MKIFNFGKKEITYEVRKFSLCFWHNKKKGKAVEVMIDFDCTEDGITACIDLELHLSLIRNRLIYQHSQEQLKKEMVGAIK